jgi:nucleoside-diphosphate-sugar epimerase
VRHRPDRNPAVRGHAAGDVQETCADIAAIRRDYGFPPVITIEEGLLRFVACRRTHPDF